MTLLEVINDVKEIIPDASTYSNNKLTAWINEVEGSIQTDVMLLAVESLVKYDYETDSGEELLVKFPYDKLYATYVRAMIYHARAEIERYNNEMLLFNEQLGAFARWFIRTYNPASGAAVSLGYYIVGPTGEGLHILGFFETLAALETAVTEETVAAPVRGDAYGIGSDTDYHYYVWDVVTESWIDNGGLSTEIATAAAALAQSWAAGGTGTRDGEDTDNAEYYAGQAEASAASAASAATAAIASLAPLYPHEALTASWNESVGADATVNKTIAHTLGAVPSRVVLYFSGVSFYTAKIEAVRNGASYYYKMSGSMAVPLGESGVYPLSADWTTEHITDNYCFGLKPLGALSAYCGIFALSDENFRIPSVTFDDENITVEILNSGEASTYFLTSVVAEVYA